MNKRPTTNASEFGVSELVDNCLILPRKYHLNHPTCIRIAPAAATCNSPSGLLLFLLPCLSCRLTINRAAFGFG